jgi:uncharacterized protein YegP (UPF0339 family)
MGKFVINKRPTGYMFNLKAGNGEIIATSEIYTSLAGCKNGVESVVKNAPIAKIEDQTVNGYAEVTNPKFEIFVDKAGEFRFRLKAPNGEIIAKSEGYVAKAGCINGVGSVQKNAKDSAVDIIED